jgi:AcrR family transcriptional regulator
MPRQVDHDERRRELIEALWRVTVRDGLDAVSFRVVASEAGVSVRRVQYYFATKAELLLGALQLLGQRTVARSAREIEAAGPDPSPRALLRAAIGSALPTDEESRTYALLFFSFYVASITNASLSTVEALAAPEWVVPFAAGVIRRGAEAGVVRAGVDPDQDALALMTSYSGLSLAVLAGLQTPDEALASIDHQLDRIFT